MSKSCNFFCLIICPSGAIYRILYKRSLINIKLSNNCTACALCANKCPTLCIDKGKIDKKACITCGECLQFCTKKAFTMEFKNPFKRKNKDKQNKQNIQNNQNIQNSNNNQKLEKPLEKQPEIAIGIRHIFKDCDS